MSLASPVPTESLLQDLLESLDNHLVNVRTCRLYCHLHSLIWLFDVLRQVIYIN